MALLDNHKKALRHIPSIGEAIDVPVRAGKQLIQTGKYLLNEGIGKATGVKMPGVKAAAEPIFGGVTDRIGNVGEMIKSEMIDRGAVPVAAQRIDAPPGQAPARKESVQPLGPADLSRMSNGQLPNDFVTGKGGVENALNAVTGPTGGAAPSGAASTSQAAPVQPIDGGSGFAMVDGKRINYKNISATGGPAKTGVATIPAIEATPADPAIGAMDREVKRIQGVQDQANLAGIGVMSPRAAARDITFRQTQQEIDQRGQRDAARTDTENKALAINAPLIDAQAKKHLSDAAVNEFAISPEGVQQAQSKEGAKDQKEAVTRYFDLFKERALPQDWSGKHMDLAKKYALSDDQGNDYQLYFHPNQRHRMGIGTSRKLFEPLLNRHLQAGHSKGDAMALAFGDLQRLSQERGQRMYEDIPNMDAFPKTSNKPADQLGV